MKKFGFFLIILVTIFLCSCDKPEELPPAEQKLKILEDTSKRWEDFTLSPQLEIDSKLRVSIKQDDYILGEEESESKVKLCQSPLYLETTDESNNIVVFQEENGKIYQYMAPIQSEPVYVNRTCMGVVGSIDDIMDEYYNTDPFAGIDIEKIEIESDGTTSTFKINMYEYLSNSDSMEEIENIFSSLGVDTSIFEETWITLSFSFKEHVAELKITMEVEYEGMKILISTALTLNNKAFNRIDFDHDENYMVLYPETIEEVDRFSVVGDTLRIPMFRQNYLKFELEKGQYGLYASFVDDELNQSSGGWYDDWMLHQVGLTLYNEMYEEIPMGMGMQAYTENFPDKTFYISEAGTYYLGVKSNISNDMNITIKPLEYKTIGFESSKPLSSDKGIIEGEYDFEVYTFEAEEDGLILFKNTGQNHLYLIYCEYTDDYGTPHYSYKNIMKEEYVKVNSGTNTFIVCSDFKFDQSPMEYSFDTEIVPLENGYEENYEDLKMVSTEFSEETYYAGYGLPSPRLALELETKSLIHFDFKVDDPQRKASARVYDLDGNILSYYLETCELEPGKYIVEFNEPYYSFAVFQIKYAAIELPDTDIDVTLSKGNLKEIQTDSFPVVTAQNIGKTQNVKYHFTLNESSKIAYQRDLKIYKEDGTVICDFNTPEYYNVVLLPKGEYYFIIEYFSGTYYDYSPQQFKMGIVEDKLDTVLDFDNMTELRIGEDLAFKRDWDYDVEYLVFNITEEGDYQFNQQLTIFNEAFNRLFTTYTYEPAHLEAGKYYLIFTSYNWSLEEVTIKVKQIHE